LDIVSFLSHVPSPPISTLFPYTTLFRSSFNLLQSFSCSLGVLKGKNYSLKSQIHSLLYQLFAVLYTSQISRKPYFPEGYCLSSQDRKSTRLNSSHVSISYAVFCLNKKNQ